MTRGLYPPSSLSKDDIKTMNNVRMDIWSNALTGLGKFHYIYFSQKEERK